MREAMIHNERFARRVPDVGKAGVIMKMKMIKVTVGCLMKEDWQWREGRKGLEENEVAVKKGGRPMQIETVEWKKEGKDKW